jgi:hypothetical protein
VWLLFGVPFKQRLRGVQRALPQFLSAEKDPIQHFLRAVRSFP